MRARAGRFGTRQIRHLKKGPTGIANNGDQWGTGESSSAFKVLVIWFYPRKNARKQVLAVGQKEGKSTGREVLQELHKSGTAVGQTWTQRAPKVSSK